MEVKISTLAGGCFGRLAMAGWTSAVPGGSVPAYALLAETEVESEPDFMPSVAKALGMDPAPGALTRHLKGNLVFELTSDGWAHLALPGNERVEYPAFREWRDACWRERYVCLYVSYAKFPAGVPVEEHVKQIVASDAYAMAIVPVA
ncbi:hypothetical protein [Streptomyces sp. NBC_01264]|uniref:hypothetical protein n=1 Tax=Streptomyces sp. NBC_01264 TaxID=2903804 RepID=UPI002255269F|nr:hypothetical protein [Streptomyces sp. NBC_01264]MCX4784327.1 hypothetical protein [Streptomyces sp. NBC_01264]